MTESAAPAAGAMNDGSITAREIRVAGTGRGELVGSDLRSLVLGDKLTVGRQGELLVGAQPLDLGVSRLAVTITFTQYGWDLELENRRGVTIHPWARQPEYAAQGIHRLVSWPRVAILVGGVEASLQHWVLLESPLFAIDGADTGGGPSGEAVSITQTLTAVRPTDITPLQLAAVQVIFADHLAWPPVANPVARSLDSARHRIGVGSESAVKARLEPVRNRAYALGLTRQVGLTDPAYIYHLAELGFFAAMKPVGG